MTAKLEVRALGRLAPSMGSFIVGEGFLVKASRAASQDWYLEVVGLKLSDPERFRV